MADVVEAPKQPAPIVALRSFLDARINEIKTALPAHMSAERFVRVVMTAIQINPDLLACNRASLWNACMRCANDGLLPDSREAALVPFKDKVTYIAMYSGLLKKFRNSGQFKWITAGIVYEGEQYEHWIDETGEHFRHVPGDDNNGKKVRRVYALATTLDGGSFIADLSLAEVNKRKAMSRASREDAPWRQWETEMQKKTAIRVLSRLLPMSSDLDSLIRRDEEAVMGVESVEDARQTMERPSSTQATLDHFAGGSTSNELSSGSGSDSRPEPESGTESGPNQERSAPESRSPEPAGAAAAPSSGTSAAAASDRQTTTVSDEEAEAQRLHQAFLDGQKAHRDGVQRKNVPEAYRRGAVLKSWTDGFDSVGE